MKVEIVILIISIQHVVGSCLASCIERLTNSKKHESIVFAKVQPIFFHRKSVTEISKLTKVENLEF